jgi:hypothetical protein
MDKPYRPVIIDHVTLLGWTSETGCRRLRQVRDHIATACLEEGAVVSLGLLQSHLATKKKNTKKMKQVDTACHFYADIKTSFENVSTEDCSATSESRHTIVMRIDKMRGNQRLIIAHCRR